MSQGYHQGNINLTGDLDAGQIDFSALTVQALQLLTSNGDGVAVGSLGIVTGTGNVYRAVTAGPGGSTWQPATGLWDLRDFGTAADGVTDDGPKIQLADTHAATQGGKVLIPGSTFATGAPLNVTTEWEFDQGGTIVPLADATVLQIKAGGRFHGPGLIDTSGVPGYASAAVSLDGDQKFAWDDNCVLDDLTIDNGSQFTGTALYLHAHAANGDHISFVRSRNLTLQGFSEGLYFHSEDPGGGGACWVNSNDFFQTTIAWCVRFVHFEGFNTAPNAVNSNVVECVIQPKAGAGAANRAVLCDGKFNRVTAQIWDWSGANVSSLNAVEFTESSERNYMLTNWVPTGMIDEGSFDVSKQNKIHWISEFQPTLYGWLPPPSQENPTMAGNQDDLLANADVYYTVTQTAGAAPSSGSINDIFTMSPRGGPRWNALAAPVTIEVDFNGTIPYVYALGCHFFAGLWARTVTFEYFKGGIWNTFSTTTTNGKQRVLSYSVDELGLDNVDKVRITIDNGGDPSGDVQLNRFFCFAANVVVRGWLDSRKIREGQASLTGWATIAPGAQTQKTISVPGAQLSGAVVVGCPTSISAGLVPFAFVSPAGTVNVRWQNTHPTNNLTPPDGTYNVRVFIT